MIEAFWQNSNIENYCQLTMHAGFFEQKDVDVEVGGGFGVVSEREGGAERL